MTCETGGVEVKQQMYTNILKMKSVDKSMKRKTSSELILLTDISSSSELDSIPNLDKSTAQNSPRQTHCLLPSE